MSTTYAPVRQVTREEIAAFEMPRPLVGQPVLYHRRGMRNDRQAVIRFVRQVHQRSVDLDGGMNNVLHADDPRLHQNEHQRENGSWEFTPYDLLLQERLAALEGNPKKAEKASPDKNAAQKG
jgi:hypothetical protein